MHRCAGASRRWRAGVVVGGGTGAGVDHSTVYRHLNQLEADLGVSLFHRARPVPARRAAVAAHAHANVAADAIVGFRRTVTGHDDRPEGVMRLAAPESPLGLLAPLAAWSRAAHPAIELKMTFGNRSPDLSRQEAEVAVRPTPIPPEGLVGRKAAAIAWATCAPVSGTSSTPLPWAVYGGELAGLAAPQWCAEHTTTTPYSSRSLRYPPWRA